ncbi:MAG: LamG-like jellyroll fold domain-containing protein [Bacteroidota bacterium]
MKKISALFLVLFLTNTVQAQIPTASLIAYYPFCGNANDLSGNGNNGTVVGASLTSDRFGNPGNAYDFNGTSNYISLPPASFASLNVYSYSMWIKPSSTLTTGFIAFSVGASSQPWCMSMNYNSPNIFAGCYNNGSSPVQSYIISSAVPITSWIHLVFTRDLTSIKLYVNSLQVAATSFSSTNNQTANYGTGTFAANFGARSNLSYYFPGKIDDARMYSSVLSQNDVNALYNESPAMISINSGTLTAPANTICAGSTVTLSSTGFTSYTWTPGSNLTGSTVTVSPSVSTTYTVIGTNTLGCTTSTSQVVSVIPSMSVSITGSPTSICAGQTASLAVTNPSNNTVYNWSTGGTGSSIGVSPTVTTTYVLTASSPFTCPSTNSITVTVNNTPTVAATVSPPVVCLNTPVILTATGATTYSWTGNVSNAVPFTPTATGQQSHTVTGTDACGTSTATISFTVNPLPNITAGVNSPTVCSGGTIVLSGGGSVGGYTWSAGAPNNVAFIPPVTGNYVVTGIGANGCTNTAVVGVAVILTPTLSPVASPTAICLGNTATLSAGGATGYTWMPGSNPATPTIIVSPQVSTTYTVYRTNGPCASTGTLNLLVNPVPSINASATPTRVCSGKSVNLIASGTNTITWLPGPLTGTNITVYPVSSTMFTVTASNGTCTSTALIPVVIDPSPTIAILSSTTTICQGSNVTLTGTGGLSYTWQPMNTTNTVEVVSPNVTTQYILTGSNSFSCTASHTRIIVVNPLPNVNLINNFPSICLGQSTVLAVTGPTNNINFTWSGGASGSSLSVNPVATTLYFVTGTNTLTGCINTNAFALSVYVPTFVVTSPTAICSGETATLTAVGPASSYSWSINTGIISPSVTVAPVVSTVYYVTGTSGNCNSSKSVTVIVNPVPNVTATVLKKQICRFELSTISANGANSYSWSTGATTPTINITLSVTTTYTLTGTDINGCSNTITVTQFVATCIGMEDHQLNNYAGLNIYPNPNNGNFTISSVDNINIRIINSLGQNVGTLKLSDPDKKEITVSNLPTGIYFITGEAGGLKVNKKIIVEK